MEAAVVIAFLILIVVIAYIERNRPTVSRTTTRDYDKDHNRWTHTTTTTYVTRPVAKSKVTPKDSIGGGPLVKKGGHQPTEKLPDNIKAPPWPEDWE